MTSAEPALLATKLRPRTPRGLVSRPRLVDRLRPTEHRLTVLVAPAGWGKTSLLTQWQAASDTPVAWLALDAGDDDPVRFWAYLVAALRAPASRLGRAPFGAGDSAWGPAGLPSLAKALSELTGPLVVVLDDYHLVTTPAVHRSVALLLDQLPPHVHVLVAARGADELPLGKLRAAGELAELRSEELAFTDAEVRAVLTLATGQVPTDADVRRLAWRTEGWPTGVALAAASRAAASRAAASLAAATLSTPAGRGDAGVYDVTGTDRFVLDYVRREVIDRLSADDLGFLLHTSVLPRLSPPLCTAVTGRSDAAAVLDRLDRAGMFLVPLDHARHRYRHHRLFGELLRHELDLSQPALVPTLHRRAAAWSAAHGEVGDAVAHYVAAGEPGEAVETVARHWQDRFVAGGRSTVTGWLDRLPSPAVRADPRLCVARAWSLFDSGHLDEIDGWIAASGLVTNPADRVGLRDLAAVHSAHRVGIGDVGAGRAEAQRALALGSEEPGLAATIGHLMVGVTAYWDGDPAGARSQLAVAVQLARRTGNAVAEAYALGYLALTAVDGGALDDAARTIAVALQKVADPGVSEHPVAAVTHLARALLRSASGRPGPARASAARAVQLARRGSGRLDLALALAVHAQTTGGATGRTQLERARRLARDCPDPGQLPVRLGRIRLPGQGHRTPAVPTEGVGLTDRERELLPFLAGSLSQREIGAVLFLSLNTVKTHCRSVFRKLGVSSRAHAVHRARELGLLQEGLL